MINFPVYSQFTAVYKTFSAQITFKRKFLRFVRSPGEEKNL